MENSQKKFFFREIDLFDFTSFFGLNFLKFSDPSWTGSFFLRRISYQWQCVDPQCHPALGSNRRSTLHSLTSCHLQPSQSCLAHYLASNALHVTWRELKKTITIIINISSSRVQLQSMLGRFLAILEFCEMRKITKIFARKQLWREQKKDLQK